MPATVKQNCSLSSSSLSLEVIEEDMRFFLECVSCGWNTATSDDELSAPETSPLSEERRYLVPSHQPLQRSASSRMRRRRRWSSRSTVGVWKPTLFVISEETDGLSSEKKAMEKKRSAVHPSTPSRGRDTCRREPIPMIVPAFAPTAFMF